MAASAVAVALALVAGQPAMAQDPFPTLGQSTGIQGDPLINSFAPDRAPSTQPRKVRLEARLTEGGPPMKYGLSWRIFKPIPGADGKLPMLASSEGGSTEFDLDPGDYFVHVAFGRAGATKKMRVPEGVDPPMQTFLLDAGGVVLDAVAGGDLPIPPSELKFAIYSNDVGESGERTLIMDDVKPGEVVRLNAGTYHVVSNYGDVNATIRADIKVDAGKLIQATIQHKAARITLKLVSQEGGEAIADTAWSILTGSGDPVSESVGAFPVIVLAEGNYIAVARHKETILQRDFTVVAGRNQDVEILLPK